MKKSILCVTLLLASSHLLAADYTWGKKEVFPIKEIIYNGVHYTGSLIASKVDNSNPAEITLENPGVLVKGLGFAGLDKVVPLVAKDGSPLCENLNFPVTNMFNSSPTNNISDYQVAVFTTKETVVIRSGNDLYLSESRIGCSHKKIDTSGD